MPVNKNFNLRGVCVEVMHDDLSTIKHYCFFIDLPATVSAPSPYLEWNCISVPGDNLYQFQATWNGPTAPHLEGPANGSDVRTFYIGMYSLPKGSNFNFDTNSGVQLFVGTPGFGELIAQGDPNYRKPPVVKDPTMTLNNLDTYAWGNEVLIRDLPSTESPNLPYTSHLIPDYFVFIFGKFSGYQNHIDMYQFVPTNPNCLLCTVQTTNTNDNPSYVIAAGVYDLSLIVDNNSGIGTTKSSKKYPNLPFDSVMIQIPQIPQPPDNNGPTVYQQGTPAPITWMEV